MLICPKEIKFNDIEHNKSLSPRSYSTINILNDQQAELLSFLDQKEPYQQGIEPGSIAYIPYSGISFIRNSCINLLNMSNMNSKEIYLNPNHEFNNMIVNEDVLLCKDANIGQTCLFLTEKESKYVHSSGVVKLNFKTEGDKYYCLAFLREEYFLKQLDSLTPKGSTIRHSGDKYLHCKIPKIREKESALLEIIINLQKNIAYSERYSEKKMRISNNWIKEEIKNTKFKYLDPSISKLQSTFRIDAGFYSRVVEYQEFCIKQYNRGYSSIKEYGFNIKRGPNLAKRDLGRSLYSEHFKKNYHLLVYPSDISDNGYILKSTYLGARNPVWFLKQGDILFSAEGTVGKVFAICDENMKFTTNFHGIIITPMNKKKTNIKKSIMLCQFLNYLRTVDYLNKVSVGGQGGSFALNYWDKIIIPNFDDAFIDKVTPLYYSEIKLLPFVFDEMKLSCAGIFEINQFRIKCSSILKKITGDIKSNRTNTRESYIEYAGYLDT